MHSISSAPGKRKVLIAASGERRAIPDATLIGITDGAASNIDGFVPKNRQPAGSGGVPPDIQDMNGFMYDLSKFDRWSSAGGNFVYDASFQTAVGGYPKGCTISKSEQNGFWMSLVENNMTDPEATGSLAAGWIPLAQGGVTPITLGGANITLTPAQYANKTIVLTGNLLANVDLIFPASTASWCNEWLVINAMDSPSAFYVRAVCGTGITTFINGYISKINNYGGMNTTSSQGVANPKFSTGSTPVTLLNLDTIPCQVLVTDAGGFDYWLLLIHKTAGGAAADIVASSTVSGISEVFTVTTTPQTLRVAVSAIATNRAYFAKVVF